MHVPGLQTGTYHPGTLGVVPGLRAGGISKMISKADV
jgi:hypothetical protein